MLVNLAVIFRRVGKLEIPAWTAFLIAAVLIVLADPSSGFDRAVEVLATQAEVFVFLFAMMVLVVALDISGVLDEIARFLLKHSKSGRSLLLWIHLGFGLSASFLINDTVAIFAPLVLIRFSSQVEKDAKPYVLAMALGLTYGSALLPTGNPQNFIIATGGNISFLQFVLYAIGPTIIALVGSYLTLMLLFRDSFTSEPFTEVKVAESLHIDYRHLQKPSLVALAVVFGGLVVSSFVSLPMAVVFLVVVGVFLFFTNERDLLLARLDWGVLFFFAGMFVVLDSVTTSPFFVDSVTPVMNDLQPDFHSYVIFIFLIFASCQLFSNVPVAIIVVQLLPQSSINLPLFWMATALTTTFAGATTVLGAASNIIVVETSQKRGVSISWLDMAKVGIPSSLIALLGVIALGVFLL